MEEIIGGIKYRLDEETLTAEVINFEDEGARERLRFSRP